MSSATLELCKPLISLCAAHKRVAPLTSKTGQRDNAAPLAPAAGVEKAPRHEVAGSLAPVGGEGYGDLIFAPAMMVGARLARGDLDRVGSGLEARNRDLGGGVKGTPVAAPQAG